MKKLVIFGNGEFASIANYYFSDRVVEFFCADDELCKENSFEKKPLIPKSELLKKNKSDFELFVAISYRNMNDLRTTKYLELKKQGFNFTSFIHKKSYISKTSTIGENCLILEGQNIQKDVEIQNNVFLWSGNHIGHNSTIKNNTYISSHVVISGNCEIGENCFFGVNSAIKDNIKIGNKCMIGMGSNVTTNLKDGSVVASEKSRVYKPEDKISKIIKDKI